NRIAYRRIAAAADNDIPAIAIDRTASQIDIARPAIAASRIGPRARIQYHIQFVIRRPYRPIHDDVAIGLQGKRRLSTRGLMNIRTAIDRYVAALGARCTGRNNDACAGIEAVVDIPDIDYGVVPRWHEAVLTVETAPIRRVVRDRHILRVQQPRSRRAIHCAGVHCAQYIQPFFARGFHHAARAAQAAASGRDFAVETGAVVGPDHDSATVALFEAVGLDVGRRAHESGAGIAFGAFALEASTDQDDTAALGAARVDRTCNRHLVAQHTGAAAFLTRLRTRYI